MLPVVATEKQVTTQILIYTWLTVLATLALVGMPNAPVLWVAAVLLWVLDASLNISMEPFRAFVGDMVDETQTTSGYAFQTAFIGAGAVAASLAPVLLTQVFGVSNVAPEGEIPPSVRLAFYLGAAALLGAVLWTVLSVKEYSPEQLRGFDGESHVPARGGALAAFGQAAGDAAPTPGPAGRGCACRPRCRSG